MAGLRALRQLDLDHLDLRVRGGFGETLGREAAIGIAAAEIAAGNLPDGVAAEFAVIAAETAFAGVMREIAELGAFVQRANGVGAERAEAHRRDVIDRGGIGVAALRAADGDAEIAADRRARRQRMVDPLEIVAVDVLLGAEGPLVE